MLRSFLPNAGATHLYLLDFSPENLPELESTIGSSYPDVKVVVQHYSVLDDWTYISQVTVIQADAADEIAIADVCKRALQDEGRLDVFFANVCIISDRQSLIQTHNVYRLVSQVTRHFPR